MTDHRRHNKEEGEIPFHKDKEALALLDLLSQVLRSEITDADAALQLERYAKRFKQNLRNTEIINKITTQLENK